MKSVKLKIFLICIILCLPVMAMADPYTTAPPMPDKYLLPDGSIQTFSGVEFAPANAGRAIIYKQSPWAIAKWLLPDGSIVAALPFSGGTGSGDVSISGTPTQYNWAEWTNATTIKGTAVTASKPVCTDANGSPVACEGTEGVWQAENADLTSISSGGTANCLWGEKSDSSGIECKTSINIQLDNTAAQIADTTDATKKILINPSGNSTGIQSEIKTNCTGDCTFNTKTKGAGTYTLQEVLTEKLAVYHWGDGSSAITAAVTTKVCADIPTAATLTGVKLTASDSPSSDVTVSLYMDVQANGATANATTAMISGTNAVVLAGAGSGLAVIDTTLTNYTTSISAGSQICAEVTATDTAKWLHLTLYGTR